MSCQSLAARAFADQDHDGTHLAALHRSVRFSSESRASSRAHHDPDSKRETPGSISLTALSPLGGHGSPMSQSAPSAAGCFGADTPSPATSACRFPKLEECAHFHYERVSLGGLAIEATTCDDECADSDEGWVYVVVRSHVGGTTEAGRGSPGVTSWRLTRNRDNFLQLDEMLHRCIYERKVSGLPNLREQLSSPCSRERYERLVGDYVHHLSIIADDSINCGPVLNWLQMDNKGHKLLVANEDSSSINTPAVAAAYSVRKYVSQARDEISFEVGDMISIIDMPGPQESVWWRGKRGFRVGFFPHHCVAVIGDKVPRHMTQPPPIVGSVAVAPMKPVLRKHGKLISLFRSFILSRPSRRSLKQQGILRERVFGCDLGEHLLNCGRDVPLVLEECALAIEARGAVDGVYRLSGGSGLTQRLRAAFDSGAVPDLAGAQVQRDPHAVPSLLKMYFRELPNPLCTYQLYESFVSAVQAPDEAARLRAVRDTVVKLPPPHYRTLAYLMRHLRRVSLLSGSTGMTARNTAIVWAPNLLRAPRPQHALQGVAVQAVVTEFLICYAEELFSQEQGADSGPESLEQDRFESITEVELRGIESCRRPKSLPVNPPTKLLSLEEARRRGGGGSIAPAAREAPPPPTEDVQLRPSSHLRPKYIEVGSGPNNLPQYHTVLDLPIAGGKRALKRSPSGWRGLFARHKVRARPPSAPPQPKEDTPADPLQEAVPGALRPVKSCESLASDGDTLPPLAVLAPAPLKHHTRSSSCDSYFEPWQAELAHMRLRLSPQERDHHMFSEEDEPPNKQQESACSSPGGSVGSLSSCSSPRRALHVDVRAANDLAQRRLAALEAQVSQLRYIDGESPRLGVKGSTGVNSGVNGANAGVIGLPPEKRHSARAASPPHADVAKRICKDRDSPMASLNDFSAALGSVKLRERHSPRKSKTPRHSGAHSLNTHDRHARLSWHGQRDGHSTLIRVDWPRDGSTTNLTATSSPGTPLTPHYDPLDSDSEVSDTNKHTIQVTSEINHDPADYENLNHFTEDLHDSLDHSPDQQNRLSAVSNSSNSEGKHDLKVMTSSHDSSSSYNSLPKGDELYECYGYQRPTYINLQSSSTSKSSPGSPLKSPLKSTISITFRSPTKTGFEETPTNDRDSVYEDIDLEKNLSIVEDASVPHTDASLPTQQACQPEDLEDLIILETPTDPVDVYSQVKFFKKSIEEVNAMLLPEDRHYENMAFEKENDYENVDLEAEKRLEISEESKNVENGNLVKAMNVRELAIRFESPTEQKPQFTFEKFKAEVKYPTLEKEESPPKSPKDFNLSRRSSIARSLDENAFVKEFGAETHSRRKSMEVRDKRPPDLNLNTEDQSKVLITPTTENKISLIQRFDKSDVKSLITVETDKQLSRERIEKYKEERRNFLREKYSSQSFRSNPEQLTRIKIRKSKEDKVENCEAEPKFERRNTVDLGQRMRFSLAKSAQELETIPSPTSPGRDFGSEAKSRDFERKEKCSPSYNIRDMAAMFEQKSQTHSG